MGDGKNEKFNDTEIQIFFSEIDNIVNEDNDDSLIKNKKELNEKCLDIIEKKKSSNDVSIQSKINLFIQEVEFINASLDLYEKEKKIKNQNEKFLKNDKLKESEDILKDVIYIELGLKDFDETNETKKLILRISEDLDKVESKEFIIAIKKSLDIRINDFRKNEITEEYFSKKINEIYMDTKNQLNYEATEKEKRLQENANKDFKNVLKNAQPKSDLITCTSSNGNANISNTNEVDTKNINVKVVELKQTRKVATTKKSNKEKKIESYNLFHKKKLKLVERWNRVAEETKIFDDYDSSS